MYLIIYLEPKPEKTGMCSKLDALPSGSAYYVILQQVPRFRLRILSDLNSLHHPLAILEVPKQCTSQEQGISFRETGTEFRLETYLLLATLIKRVASRMITVISQAGVRFKRNNILKLTTVSSIQQVLNQQLFQLHGIQFKNTLLTRCVCTV